MDDGDRMRARFGALLSESGRGVGVADRICGMCVEMLAVDGAAVSMIHQGAMSRSFGASSEMSRELDELQFTFGEGPCLDAVESGSAVMVADLATNRRDQWPAFSAAALDLGVRAVFALPVSVASLYVGALDLYRGTPGALQQSQLVGGLIAAEYAALPLLDMMGTDLSAAVDDDTSSAWNSLTALTRVEVYQAAGILIAQLGVSATEALMRLRAYAFAHDRSASQVAFDIIEHRLLLHDDQTADGDI